MKKLIPFILFIGCASPPVEVPPPVEITFGQSVKIIPYAEGYLENDTAHIWIYGHAVNVTEKRLEPVYPVGYIFSNFDSLYANKPSLTERGSFGVLADPPAFELKTKQSHLDPNIRVHFLIAIKFLYVSGPVYWDVGVTIDEKSGLGKREARELKLNRVQ